MKPDCTHCREQFSEYLEGLLAAGERVEVDAHLAGCRECRRELARWRATLHAVGELPRQAAPEGFRMRVMARLPFDAAQGGEAHAEPARPGRPRLLDLWMRALPVAAMLLLVFGVLAIVERSGTLRPREQALALARRPQPASPAAAAPGVGGQMRQEEASRETAARFALQPVAKAADEARVAGRMLAGQPAMQQAERRDLASARGPAVADALKDRGASRMEAMVVAAPGRPAGGELVFQQTLTVPRAVQHPEQVLTLYAADPAELIHRAVEVANRQGLEVTLVFKPNGQADISIQVPTERYEALVTALADLAAPESQALSNSALGQGAFFHKVLDNYNASNQLRQKERAQQAQMAAMSGLNATERLRGSQEGAAARTMARTSASSEARRAAVPAAGPAPARTTGNAPARSAAVPPLGLRYATAETPSVVNLQISIQRRPSAGQ